MPHPFNIADLAGQIIGELSAALGNDITEFVAFADRQARGLAKQAAWITEATLNGELEADDRKWFLDNLEAMAANFARVVAALTLLTIEKAWNAIVGTIWGAINRAIGGLLPVPAAPGPLR